MSYELSDQEIILYDISAERERQETLKVEGRFEHTLADADFADGLKLACIIEEVAEVGKCLLAKAGTHNDGDSSDKALYKELTQISALCVAWCEFLLANHEYGLA